MLKKFLLGSFIAAFALVASAQGVEAAYTHGATLKYGSRGAQVMELQKTLNMTASCKVAVSGAGSPGMETSYFGPATKAAVKCFQASQGLGSDGIVGPMTGAKLVVVSNGSVSGNFPAGCTSAAGYSSTTGQPCAAIPSLPAGCTSTAGYSPTTGAKCDGSSTGGSSTGFNYNGNTQGSIETYTLGSRNKTEALEGQSNVEIYAVDAKTRNDGPVLLQSADVWFAEQDAGTESSRPWNYFTSVSLLVNGQVVKTINTDSSSAWSDYSDGQIDGVATAREYRLRFTGLSSVLASNATTKISVAVSMVGNLDSADESADWEVELGNLRVLDESGLTVEANTGAASAQDLEETFTVGGAKTASLEVRAATDKIDAKTIEVDDDNDTNDVSVFNFTIKEKNGVAATVKEVTATFTTGATAGTTTENTVIRRAYLYEGSTKVGDETVPDAGAVTFDNMNIALGANQTKTFTVKLDFYNTDDNARYAEGTTVKVVINDITLATDANGNDEGDMTISVSAASDEHELRSMGVRVAVVGTPTAAVTPVDGAVNDLAAFTWTVDVTAYGDNDVYINADAADVVASDTAADVDTIYSVESTANALTALGGTVVTSSGSNVTANIAGDDTAYGAAYNGETFFKIAAGTTGRFTITVNGTNQTAAQQVRALLNNIEWTTDDVTSASAKDGSTADINAYTFNLGTKAATPFVVIN